MPVRAGKLVLVAASAALALVPVTARARTGGQLQQPGSSAQGVQASSPGSTTAASPVSALVQPATTQLAQTLPTLHPDKWKLSGELRRRAEDNLSSISNDLSSTLPGLVTAADGPQPTLASLFALSRNVRALYDVVLRVATAAEIAAPDQQAAALTEALNGLATARQQLDERLDSTAASGQQQLTAAQASLASAQAALAQSKAAAEAAKPAATTHTRTRPRRKPATAPATPPS